MNAAKPEFWKKPPRNEHKFSIDQPLPKGPLFGDDEDVSSSGGRSPEDIVAQGMHRRFAHDVHSEVRSLPTAEQAPPDTGNNTREPK